MFNRYYWGSNLCGFRTWNTEEQGVSDGTKSPPASSTNERVEHLHSKNILFRHWCLARAAARFVNKKSLTGSTPPGIYPVAHDDPLMLLGIYTHAMEWLPQVFKGTRQMYFNPLRKPSILGLTMRDQILMNRVCQLTIKNSADLAISKTRTTWSCGGM